MSYSRKQCFKDMINLWTNLAILEREVIEKTLLKIEKSRLWTAPLDLKFVAANNINVEFKDKIIRMTNMCPCCEYAKTAQKKSTQILKRWQMCAFCPIKEWRTQQSKCNSSNSLFQIWREHIIKKEYDKASETALAIVAISMKELRVKKESVSIRIEIEY